MKLSITHPRSQVVMTAIVTIAVSVGCSASRSAGSPTQATDSPTIVQSSSPIVDSSAREKTPCTLNMSAAPVIKGLKLGMTPDDVLALFPGSKDDPDVRALLARPPSQFGVSELVISPAKYESGKNFAETNQISFTLLDGRVSNFHIGFAGPEFSHVDQFITKFFEGANLPGADQWEPYVGMDHQMKTLTCVDFSIRVFAGGQGGNLNYILFEDLEADKKLKERRKKAREQASPRPGNQ